MKAYRWIFVTLSGLVILTLAAGVLVFGVFSRASASAAQPGEFVSPPGSEEAFPRPPRINPQRNEFLAEALGITLEELQAAEKEAYAAAVQQALDEELITQAQADRLNQAGRFPRFALGALLVGPDSGIDMESLLAEALGITVDELQEARVQAQDLAWEQAVEDGKLSEEQVELIKARQALIGEIDFRSLGLEALGITQDELESYREQGLERDEILEELGLTAEEVKERMLEAFKNAVAEAVADGVITQAQADLLLEKAEDGFPFGMFQGRMRPGGGGMRPGGRLPPFSGDFAPDGMEPGLDWGMGL